MICVISGSVLNLIADSTDSLDSKPLTGSRSKPVLVSRIAIQQFGPESMESTESSTDHCWTKRAINKALNAYIGSGRMHIQPSAFVQFTSCAILSTSPFVPSWVLIAPRNHG